MCFSLAWVEQLLVWLVIVIALISILKILLPFLAGLLGGAGSVIMQIIEIVIWAGIAICVIYFCFALLACISNGGLPLFPHSH